MQTADSCLDSGCRSVMGCLLGLLCLSGCDFSWMGPTASTHCAVTAELSVGDVVEIETRQGSVRVQFDPSLTNAEVEADIRCGGTDLDHAQARAAAAQIAAQRWEDGGLRIEPAFPERIFPHDAASFVVRLPSAAGVRVTTSNGAVVIHGVDGATTGSVSVLTSNAPVEVRRIDGDVELTSSNGALVAVEIDGSIRARTSNAPVHVVDPAGEVVVDTSNASIVLDGGSRQEGPVRLDTSNGPIAATFGPAFCGRLEFDTSLGGISVRDVSHRVVDQKLQRSDGYVVVGEAASISRLDTSNGHITVEIR